MLFIILVSPFWCVFSSLVWLSHTFFLDTDRTEGGGSGGAGRCSFWSAASTISHAGEGCPKRKVAFQSPREQFRCATRRIHGGSFHASRQARNGRSCLRSIAAIVWLHCIDVILSSLNVNWSIVFFLSLICYNLFAMQGNKSKRYNNNKLGRRHLNVQAPN